MDSDFDDDYKAFTSLNAINEYFEDQEFVCALDVHSICADNLVNVAIISDEEVINIRLTTNENGPLGFKSASRIKGIAGRQVIATNTSSFLLARNGHLHKFKSNKTLLPVTLSPTVFHLSCFPFADNRFCFLMISLSEDEKENPKVVLQLHKQFFEADYLCAWKELDLITEEEQIACLENNLTGASICGDYVFASEVLIDIASRDPTAVEFFNAFLNINIMEEGVKDIVLLSCNDRLNFVKYRGSMAEEQREREDADEEISLEPVLVAKATIRHIKYMGGALMVVDDFWMLTVYFFCPTTSVIKKRELPLIGNVSCVRFMENYLIYSNMCSIVFMKFLHAEEEPETFEIDLKMVVTFTVIHSFLLAIDRNNFFYRVPIRPPMFIHNRVKESAGYQELTDADIIRLPRAIQYLKIAEKEFQALSDDIERESCFDIFLDHLLESENFIAGTAEIEFLPGLPKAIDKDDIVCAPTNSRAGRSYIKVSLALEAILTSFAFTIAFYRHVDGRDTLVRHNESKERNGGAASFAAYVPAEMEDRPENRMELFVHFNFNSYDDRHVLQFPLTITRIVENELYASVVPSEMDMCAEKLAELLR